MQEGFKLLHGLTTCDYVKSVRLKKSEELISTTDLTVYEIVYSLGLSSRSYFSKIFKEKQISSNICLINNNINFTKASPQEGTCIFLRIMMKKQKQLKIKTLYYSKTLITKPIIM